MRIYRNVNKKMFFFLLFVFRFPVRLGIIKEMHERYKVEKPFEDFFLAFFSLGLDMTNANTTPALPAADASSLNQKAPSDGSQADA